MTASKLRRKVLIVIMSLCFCLTFIHASVFASGKFEITVDAGESRNAGSEFPMEAGETVTIRAVYSPASASVDLGLVDKNGTFYYETGVDGVFNETIKITKRGNYTFAVRNNSKDAVDISGYVSY